MGFVVENEIRTRYTADGRQFTSETEAARRKGQQFGADVSKAFDKTGKSSSALNQMQKLGAERMTKYGTVVGQLTGGITALGIKNEVLGRSIGVVMDGMTGMLGTVGAVTLAIGGLAAGIGYLVGKHREWDESMKSNVSSLLARYAKSGITSDIGRLIVNAESQRLTAEKTRLEGTIADIQKTLEVGLFKLDPLTKKILGYDEMERLRGKAAEALVQLAKVTEELEQIKLARLGPFVGPPGSAAGGGGTTIITTGGPSPASPGFTYQNAGVMGPDKTLAGIFAEPSRIRAIGPMIEEAVNVPLMDTLSTTDKLQQSLLKLADNFPAIAAAASAAYSTMQKHAAAMSKFQEITTRRIGRMLIASYREGAAAYIEAEGQKSAIDAMREGAKAIGALASGDVKGFLGHMASSAQHLAIAGAATIGASIVRGSSGAGGGGEPGGGEYPTGPSTPNAGPSNRLVGPEAGPTSIVYNVIWQQYGTVIYGAAGLRDWYQRELRELIRADFGKGNL